MSSAPLAHAEDHVRRDAPAPEDLDRSLPRAEVALDAALRLARARRARARRGRTSRCGCRPRRRRRACTSSSTRSSSGGSNCTCTGIPPALLDRGRALRDVQRAAVAPVQRPGGERHVDRAIQVARGGAHLGELGRRLDRDRLLAARQLDAAERALLRRVPVDALLDDGRGDRVEVQQRDLPVRHAVGRLHVVDPRAARDAHRADILGAVQQQRALVRQPQRVWRFVARTRRASGRSAAARAPR